VSEKLLYGLVVKGSNPHPHIMGAALPLILKDKGKNDAPDAYFLYKNLPDIFLNWF